MLFSETVSVQLKTNKLALRIVKVMRRKRRREQTATNRDSVTRLQGACAFSHDTSTHHFADSDASASPAIIATASSVDRQDESQDVAI